jgi:SEC-C motif domain protein
MAAGSGKIFLSGKLPSSVRKISENIQLCKTRNHQFSYMERMFVMNCPCGSEKPFETCCEPLITGSRKADTAEELLRARFSAFVRHEAGFILNTVHPDKRSQHDEKAIMDWARKTDWSHLEIIEVGDGSSEEEQYIEFIAHFRKKGLKNQHHELACFKKKDGEWFFFDGDAPKVKQVVHTAPKVGRNDPCVCGSGKKFKKCCGL